MDFGVVVSSVIEILIVLIFSDGQVPSLKMLRALRVFRPLRTVKRFKSMRRLVSIMLRSIPDLGNTLTFIGFFFMVLGIVGVQIFRGNTYQRCRLTEYPENG